MNAVLSFTAKELNLLIQCICEHKPSTLALDDLEDKLQEARQGVEALNAKLEKP